MTGKKIRQNRFFYKGTKVGLVVPMDHGLTIGPVEGIESPERIASFIGSPALTGVILHKGMIERLQDSLGHSGVMLHVNGMSNISSNPDKKEQIATIETAVRLGADGISLQVNFDGLNDDHNLKMLGSVVDDAQRFGLPVLTMLYDKVNVGDKQITRLRHLMRIAVELGTDALKLAAPEKLELLPEILNGFTAHTNIFFAGGSLSSEAQMLQLATAVVEAGASGLCIGRNVFQRENPNVILAAIQNRLLDASVQRQPLRMSQYASH